MRRPTPLRTEYQDEDARRRRREYQELMQEKTRISDRMAELERLRRSPDHFINPVRLF